MRGFVVFVGGGVVVVVIVIVVIVVVVIVIVVGLRRRGRREWRGEACRAEDTIVGDVVPVGEAGGGVDEGGDEGGEHVAVEDWGGRFGVLGWRLVRQLREAEGKPENAYTSI